MRIASAMMARAGGSGTPPIQFVGAVSGLSPSLPAHQAGDIIISFGFKNDGLSTTTNPITNPAGWTSITGINLATTVAASVCFKVAADGATTGTWTNASDALWLVYRNASLSRQNFSSSGRQTVNSSAKYALTGLNATLAEGSWLVALGGHQAADTSIDTFAPAPASTRRATDIASCELVAWDSAAPVVGPLSDATANIGGTSANFWTLGLELIQKP